MREETSTVRRSPLRWRSCSSRLRTSPWMATSSRRLARRVRSGQRPISVMRRPRVSSRRRPRRRSQLSLSSTMRCSSWETMMMASGQSWKMRSKRVSLAWRALSVLRWPVRSRRVQRRPERPDQAKGVQRISRMWSRPSSARSVHSSDRSRCVGTMASQREAWGWQGKRVEWSRWAASLA